MTQDNKEISLNDSSNEQLLGDEIAVRNQKLQQLKDQGIAYPNSFRRDSTAAALHQLYDDKTKAEIEELMTAQATVVKVAGRIMTRRQMGKANFITLQDVTGTIQLYIAKNNIAPETYDKFLALNDLGDIIGAQGIPFKTNTGELSIKVDDLEILTKALRPLPSKFHGLTDQETRYRQRYLDLISNEQSREVFVMRSKIIEEIRQFFLQRDFMEVETPMLQVIPGGASAKPFVTHHNALDINMYMRISPELYLKRLVVGGFERVFEINRSFRNEGLSVRHNPEFTMLEYYQAYSDMEDLIVNTETLFSGMAEKLLGTSQITYGDLDISLAAPYQRYTMVEAILKFGGSQVSADDLVDYQTTAACFSRLGGKVEKSWGHGRLISEIFELVAEEHLIQPTFITLYPAEISPLARRNDLDPNFTDRFEFFIGGREISNGFSELNDSKIQAQAFDDQVASKDAGDDEAMFYDHDFVTALEQGLPPTAGQGIGIDRVVMLFTNSPSIKDVILFPTMRLK